MAAAASSAAFSERYKSQPSPLDFDVFLPWACKQLQMKEVLILNKVTQTEYVSVQAVSDRLKKKGKSRVFKTDSMDKDRDDQSESQMGTDSVFYPSAVKLTAVYDEWDRLIHLKFTNNKDIPRLLMRILNLIIQFHENLNMITINKGLTAYTIHDINKLLPMSYLTDICLDDCKVPDGNYHILLEQNSILRHLSLCRCGIEDSVVISIAATLPCPEKASKTLSILNLSSNKITDIGAKHLAEALRSNRKLSYLNLADNKITDVGSEYLFNILIVFRLTFSELISSRSRHITFLKKKNELIDRMMKDLRFADTDKRAMRKKTKPLPTPKKKGVETDTSRLSDSTVLNFDGAIVEKATTFVENTLGPYSDPFDKNNTFVKHGLVCCRGNTTLNYLSLAYNHLTYLSLKRLLNVLEYQKEMSTIKLQRGLINVSIEGNYMPVACKELSKIDYYIEAGFMMARRNSAVKKRVPPKSGR